MIDDLLPMMAANQCPYAGACLSNLGKSAIPRLQAMMGDPNPSISGPASAALVYLARQDLRTLLQGLDSPNGRLVTNTALLLSRFRESTEAVPALKKLASDPRRSDAVRVAAARAVVALAPRSAELAGCVMPAARMLRADVRLRQAAYELLVALAEQDRLLVRPAASEMRKALAKDPGTYASFQGQLRALIEKVESP